jgi:hypothetical protein
MIFFPYIIFRREMVRALRIIVGDKTNEAKKAMINLSAVPDLEEEKVNSEIPLESKSPIQVSSFKVHSKLYMGLSLSTKDISGIVGTKKRDSRKSMDFPNERIKGDQTCPIKTIPLSDEEITNQFGKACQGVSFPRKANRRTISMPIRVLFLVN